MAHDGPGEGTRPGPGPDTFLVRGVFTDITAATDAVHGLAENSVPADIIDVFVLDEHGSPTRAVPVEDESGVLRGAMIGASGGAVLGLVIVVLIATGVIVDADVDPLDYDSIAGALQIMATAAVAGIPLGAILGMGHWQGRKKVALEEGDSGSIMVVVATKELSEVARRVLEGAGAHTVTMGRGLVGK